MHYGMLSICCFISEMIAKILCKVHHISKKIRQQTNEFGIEVTLFLFFIYFSIYQIREALACLIVLTISAGMY